MEETKTPWSVYVVYMLVLLFMMVAGTVKGQNICKTDVCVVEFNAGWNEAIAGGYCTVHAKVEQGAEEVQCSKIKSDGERCKMKTKNKSGLCYYHD